MKKNFQSIVLLLILMIGLLIVYNFSVVQYEMTENQYNALINDLRKDATSFGLWVNHKTSILNTAKEICSNFTRDEIIQSKTKNPYLNINKDEPNISAIYIGLSDGKFVTGGHWVPPDDYDPRTRTWYKEAVEMNETIISSPYIDRESGDPVVTISSPLYLEDAFVGVISADVFLRDIEDFLVTQIQNEYSHSMLINENGMLIIDSSDMALEGKNIYTDIGIPEWITFFNKAKETNDIVRMTYTHQGNSMIGIIQKVDGRNWYLAIMRVNENRFVNVLLNKRGLLFVNTLLTLVIISLLYIIMKRRLELQNINDLLKVENQVDYLTGIYNRRYLNLYLEKIWNRNDFSQLTIFIIDVDYFKSYNDTYGHILGDDVLKTLTKSLSEQVDEKTALARFGGEEFAVVLENIDHSKAKSLALKMLNAVYDLNLPHKNSPFKRITISIGAVTLNDFEDISVRDALEFADKALYEAKASGRNCFRGSVPLTRS